MVFEIAKGQVSSFFFPVIFPFFGWAAGPAFRRMVIIFITGEWLLFYYRRMVIITILKARMIMSYGHIVYWN